MAILGFPPCDYTMGAWTDVGSVARCVFSSSSFAFAPYYVAAIINPSPCVVLFLRVAAAVPPAVVACSAHSHKIEIRRRGEWSGAGDEWRCFVAAVRRNKNAWRRRVQSDLLQHGLGLVIGVLVQEVQASMNAKNERVKATDLQGIFFFRVSKIVLPFFLPPALQSGLFIKNYRGLPRSTNEFELCAQCAAQCALHHFPS